MAMWFSHLRYVEAAAARLDRDLDRLSLCWGAVCCDVDKVSPVPRETSHYGREGLSFEPEAFLEQAGLTATEARPSAAFLAGYLSHLAVDEAWYTHLFALRDAPQGLGTAWSYETTRALNLALDQRNRSLYDPAGLDFSQARGEEVLPHLGGPIRQIMVHAASAYAAWPGHMSWAPQDPLLGPVMARFRALAAAEADRVVAILDALSPEDLDQDVVAFTTRTLGRFLDDLAQRPA